MIENGGAASKDAAADVDGRSDIERERDEYLETLQRLQAEFENYRKRVARSSEEAAVRSAGSIVVTLLPVLDAFDLARAHLGEGDNVSPEGKALVAGSTLLADTLAREGLERIGCGVELAQAAIDQDE